MDGGEVQEDDGVSIMTICLGDLKDEGRQEVRSALEVLKGYELSEHLDSPGVAYLLVGRSRARIKIVFCHLLLISITMAANAEGYAVISFKTS